MVANGIRNDIRSNSITRVFTVETSSVYFYFACNESPKFISFFCFTCRKKCVSSCFSSPTGNRDSEGAADYEKAISATGFGTYNIVLLLATIPAGLANNFDLTTAAFLLASAECDLELTYLRKGALVSAVYIGMIVSLFFWGSVMDSARRKPLFIIGLLGDACCNIISSVIDSYHVFFLIKFITGTIVSGPFALLIPYVAEFQPLSYRAKFVGWTGFIYGFGNIIPALLGVIILPLTIRFSLFGQVFNAWRIYILVCTIPSIVGLVTMSLMPESPKRLISIGQTAKALELLRKMYTINTGNPPETFPIKSLAGESMLTSDKSQSNFEKMRDSWNHFKALLQPPYLGTFFVICCLQFGSMLGFNTMRLWVPHMFMIMSNFDYTLWDSSRGMPTMCELLIPGIVPPGLDDPAIYANITDTCIRWNINPLVYVNSTIIAASAVGFSFFIVMHLDTRIKKKFVLIAGFLIGTISGFAVNWAQLVPIMLCLCASIAVTSRISGNIVIAINATAIPAQLRMTATSFVTMLGSLGTVVGNLIFSSLLDTHCVGAFMWLGCSVALCVVVALFALRPPTEGSDPESNQPKMVTRF